MVPWLALLRTATGLMAWAMRRTGGEWHGSTGVQLGMRVCRGLVVWIA
jgi:hypothetical protein